MTFAQTRDAFATALDAVGGGIAGHKYRPSVPAGGDCFPLMGPAERGPGDAFAVTWRVVMVGGGDEAAAEAIFDGKLPAVTAALEPLGYVSGWRPATLATEAGPLQAIVIDVLREADPT